MAIKFLRVEFVLPVGKAIEGEARLLVQTGGLLEFAITRVDQLYTDAFGQIARSDVARHNSADRVAAPRASLNVDAADLFAGLHGDFDGGVPRRRWVIGRRFFAGLIATDVNTRARIRANDISSGFKPVDAVHAAVIRSLSLGAF